MITSFQNLLNSGSKNMNVNGSSTPQVFSYSPGGGSTSAITGLILLLKHDGNTAFTNFGAISGSLTNGLLLQVNINGSNRTLTTIKDNADLCTRFHFNQFGNGAVLSILSIVTPEGFGNSNNVFIGFMEFQNPLILIDTDSISMTVQDDLHTVSVLQVACKLIMD